LSAFRRQGVYGRLDRVEVAETVCSVANPEGAAGFLFGERAEAAAAVT